MDVLQSLGSTGTVSIQIALIVAHIIYLSVTMKSVSKEFEEHKVFVNGEIKQIHEDMGRNDIIFRELQTNMTKVLTSLEFIQEALKDMRKGRK